VTSKRAPSPTKLSIDYLRAQGYVVGQVERINRGAATRGIVITHDLFGFADLVAVRADVPGVLLVQVTAGGNGPARERKILSLTASGVCRRAGNRIEVHDWRKRGKLKQPTLYRTDIGSETVVVAPATSNAARGATMSPAKASEAKGAGNLAVRTFQPGLAHGPECPDCRVKNPIHPVYREVKAGMRAGYPKGSR